MKISIYSWACLTIFMGIEAVKANPVFLDVRKGPKRYSGGNGGSTGEKYFNESTFNAHYDGRFADKEVEEHERLDHLTALMQTFLSSMSDLGVESWIMHGSLLGWWWNQRILPWDSDLDLQVSEETIYYLARHANMSEYHFSLPGLSFEKKYLLEVNPHYQIRGTEDELNVIDARWIDTQTGLFIDISTVRKNWTATEEGVEGALMCKDKHRYLESQLYPLRDSFFEGVPVKVPFEYSWLLEEEYGKTALALTQYENHRWNETSRLWEQMLAEDRREPREQPRPYPLRGGPRK